MNATGSRSADDAEVMASLDDDGTYVIADISEDEAWLSMGTDAAAPLPDWR